MIRPEFDVPSGTNFSARSEHQLSSSSASTTKKDASAGSVALASPTEPIDVSILGVPLFCRMNSPKRFLESPPPEILPRTISQKVLRRADHPHRVHTPNEPAKFTSHFHIALLRTEFGSSQKPTTPDHKTLTAPQTLALYPARKRRCFTEPIDVGWHIAPPSQSTQHCRRTLRVSRLLPVCAPVPKCPPTARQPVHPRKRVCLPRSTDGSRTCPDFAPI